LRKNTKISQQVVYEISSSSSSENISVDSSLETLIGEQGCFSTDDSHPAGGPKGSFVAGEPQGSFEVGKPGSSPPTVAGVGKAAWMKPLAVQQLGQTIVHLVFSSSSSSSDRSSPSSEPDNARPQGSVEYNISEDEGMPIE
jgi:hypothetical protein